MSMGVCQIKHRAWGLWHGLCCAGICLWLICWASGALASAASGGSTAQALPGAAHSACTAQMLGAAVAPEATSWQRPADGWVQVELPHLVPQVWRTEEVAMWYHIRWQLHCPADAVNTPHTALALGITGIRMAGTVYWNDTLLWSDRSLSEPLSRSWNIARWWPVHVGDASREQAVWVRVVSIPTAQIGIGQVELGSAADISAAYEYRFWRQRTSYMVMTGLAVAISCVALVVWLWRRSERLYLWMGLMQAFWALYLMAILATDSWPGVSTHGMGVARLLAYLLFMQCFFIFTLRFGEQRFARLERCTWGVLALWVLLAVCDREGQLPWVASLSMCWGALIANGSCWYFQYRAWQTRQPQHILLALCWLVMGVVGLHDIDVALQLWHNDQTWMAFTGPITMLVLGGLLGWQVAHHMRRIDGFNTELQARVHDARTELALALEREHAQALQHAKLQERVQLAHDLHDGLGGSLVRSMALVEQAPQQLSNERVLSLLKMLRDDLRQVIDSGSSGGMEVPETPGQWLAPLRHRFMHILDELGMQAHWQVDSQWRTPPAALQCMTLVRFLEEAFANVLKHSRARRLTLCCTQPRSGVLVVSVHDDGIGFDVPAVMQAGMSVGMRSMHSRIAKIGGQLSVHSGAQGTQLIATVAVGSAHMQTAEPEVPASIGTGAAGKLHQVARQAGTTESQSVRL